MHNRNAIDLHRTSCHIGFSAEAKREKKRANKLIEMYCAFHVSLSHHHWYSRYIVSFIRCVSMECVFRTLFFFLYSRDCSHCLHHHHLLLLVCLACISHRVESVSSSCKTFSFIPLKPIKRLTIRWMYCILLCVRRVFRSIYLCVFYCCCCFISIHQKRNGSVNATTNKPLNTTAAARKTSPSSSSYRSDNSMRRQIILYGIYTLFSSHLLCIVK